MPKVKAIGTPMMTQAATMTTKNRIRLACPIATSSGCASHNPPAIAADQRQRQQKRPATSSISSSRNNATVAISPAPTRMRNDPVPVRDLQRDQLDRALDLEVLLRRHQ